MWFPQYKICFLPGKVCFGLVKSRLMTLHSVICACLLTGEKMGTLNTPEMRGGNDHIFDLCVDGDTLIIPCYNTKRVLQYKLQTAQTSEGNYFNASITWPSVPTTLETQSEFVIISFHVLKILAFSPMPRSGANRPVHRNE